MDDLNPGSDEPILKKFPKIIVNGVRYEAVLTNRRIVLTERETGKIFKDILYSAITRAVSGVNSIREPTLLLSINPPAGEERSLELIFVYQPGGMNVQNIESCADILQDHQVTVQRIKSPYSAGPMNRIQALTPGMQAGVEGESRPAVPDMGLMSTLRSGRELPPEESQKTPYLIAIVGIVVILAVIAAGVFIAGQGPDEIIPSTNRNSSYPVPTETAAPTVVVTTTTPVAPALTVTPSQMTVPPNGIWFSVTYPGNFTGTVKAKGWETAIGSSGTYLVQLPVENALIEGSVGKADGTGDAMEVVVLNGGTGIWKGSTTKPYGTIEIRVPVGTAVISMPPPAPAPTEIAAAPTPDTSLVLPPIPATGVWVRVAYPGNYTGTIRTNGIERDVNGSGVRDYQVALTVGNVQGIFKKEDGSAKNLVVQIYRENTLIALANTSKPQGIVEFQTLV
ncbi:MAG: hypothetical protein CVV32_08195 [Methanomicrobiales archaeon HGW-Methanomicrobiales-3]|jgi:hypothetical protein|nr:MAG: hypothetical protein CVV32_08195 [Methanomicrobiales archaeon HGW-Methanomicrobiales-3]